MIKISTYHRAVFELGLAGIIWGASFTFVRWALVDFTTANLMFWRLLIAFIVGESIFCIISPKRALQFMHDARTAMPAGIFLGLSLYAQTYGLNYTTATNSGFITSLYVVLIPIIAALFFKQAIKPRHVFLSLMAFTGMGFLLNLTDINIQKGELLTLFAAVTAAFQIIFIGKTTGKAHSSFRFNNFQIFWCWITILPFLVIEMRSSELGLKHIWPQNVQFFSVACMLILALFVSLFAFFLQVKSQKVLNTTTASMLCLLEGPFAFVFAAIFLGEKLNASQFFGTFLILLSCYLSIYLDQPEPTKS